jgi:hypothetical protein
MTASTILNMASLFRFAACLQELAEGTQEEMMLTAAWQSLPSETMQPSCGRLRIFTRPVLYRTRVLALGGACLTSASPLRPAVAAS